MNIRDSLLSAFTSTPVPFSFGGESFFLRPLVTSDMLAAREWAKENGKAYEFLFVRSICDSSGTLVFSDEDTAIVDTLAGGMVDAVIARVYQLGGMSGGTGGVAGEKKA